MRICLVASELLGAHKNGGIGTATSHLANFLAVAGHKVHILYTGFDPIDFLHPWIKRLQGRDIQLTHIYADQSPVYPRYLREASAVFEYLRFLPQDLIIFQDWKGGAASCVNARRAGIAFHQTRLAVIAHGPTEWLLDANRQPAKDRVTLVRIHMEREVFNGVDAIVCPSRYMLNWLGQAGYTLDRASAVPLYLWSDPETDSAVMRAEPINKVSTLAFFGRLEERKGINLFIKAILDDRLADRNFDIVFLGKEASLTEANIRAHIYQTRPEFLPRIRFEKSLDSEQAQAFLVRENCLAIVPSLTDNAPCVISECVRRKIPFIATSVGGIPELISAQDRDRVLVMPTSNKLAERLAQALDRPFLPVESGYLEMQVADLWHAWIEKQCPGAVMPRSRDVSNSSENYKPASTKDSVSGELIAIVLTHYERPELVNQAINALSIQTNLNFELVLVDDGSKSLAALANLEVIERTNWPFPVRILRQNNAYLGAARNAGIKATDAQRLIFFDDDNVAFPDLVDVLSRAQSNTDADIVTCQMNIFRDATGKPDLRALQSGDRWGFAGGPTELGLSVNCFGDATGIYKRSVFDRVGWFHERKNVGHEDWHLHARAALAGLKHVCLPVPLYWYRRTEAGMLFTTDMFENNRIIWDAYRFALPKGLNRIIDLSIRNSFSGDDPVSD